MSALAEGNFKRHNAPGESYMDGFSDRGSTPLASTTHYHVSDKITKNTDKATFVCLVGVHFFCPPLTGSNKGCSAWGNQDWVDAWEGRDFKDLYT